MWDFFALSWKEGKKHTHTLDLKETKPTLLPKWIQHFFALHNFSSSSVRHLIVWEEKKFELIHFHSRDMMKLLFRVHVETSLCKAWNYSVTQTCP